MVIKMEEKIGFLERLKELLLAQDWNTVSIYKTNRKVLVYVNGGLELEYEFAASKIESEEGEE